MLTKKVDTDRADTPDADLAPLHASRALNRPVPRYELADDEMPGRAAYQLIHDELALDGNPLLNLASFVTTWMDREADRLLAETLSKNSIDEDEYPQTVEIQRRCVNIVARLFNAPRSAQYVGTPTIGSSEAIHLGGLALKWQWRARRRAAGLATDRPNLVMGANVQVVWEKFCRYFDVEPRYVPCAEGRYILGVEEALAMVDENTIGVVGILGSTYTGEFEPIEELNDALVALNAEKGWDVPIHVDAASGGFVAPFAYPDLAWDFRLPLVKSINVSGHKYGLVYPGVGWVVWRDQAELPDDLIFHVNYLGGDQPTFNLNFSRAAGQIIAQYYNFLRLGRAGYSAIMQSLIGLADHLSDALDATEHFEVIGRGDNLPVVCFRLTGERPYTAYEISDGLRAHGWIVPAYTMPKDIDTMTVLRVVVRESLSRDLCDSLVEDLKRVIHQLEGLAKQGASAEPLQARPQHLGAGSPTTGEHGVC